MCSTARWPFPRRIRTSRTERFTWWSWTRAWARTRRPILASSDGYHFVAPDNGVLSMVYAKEERIHVRHITSEHYFRQPVSNTFHARDMFAPVAAYLAKLVDSHKFGDEIEDYVRFAAPKPKAAGENRLRAVVLKVDRFGNLITNVTPADAPALFAESAKFKIVVGSREITDIRKTFAEGGAGGSLRHSRQHGLSRDRGQPRGRGAESPAPARARSQHLLGRSGSGRQGGVAVRFSLPSSRFPARNVLVL